MILSIITKPLLFTGDPNSSSLIYLLHHGISISHNSYKLQNIAFAEESLPWQKKDITITFTSASDRPFDQALKSIIKLKAGETAKITLTSKNIQPPVNSASNQVKQGSGL
ncbi:MAG: hypothetical protein LIO96_06240 [Lachnospiraceae bacterium]|nr:hypothetical protein [Lachnospiraceae bacterium]